MARSNEYQSPGGTFEKLSDAISSIDQLLQDVKLADAERGDVPEKQRCFRHVIAELQSELDQSVTELRKRFAELDLDPLYIYTTEEISVTAYTRHIKFIHPRYEHVWLTEGKNQNVASQLIPFINYDIKYDYENQRVTVTNRLLKTKLNLPDFKTSLQAAHVDLEILKQDTQRVEMVCENGEAAHKKLSETLTAYCESHNIELEINEETVPFMESEEERADRQKKEAEVAQKAEQEARKKAEAKARAAKKKAEEEKKAAKKKAEEETRAAKKKEEAERAAKKKAEEEARAAKKKAEAERAAKKKEEAERAAKKEEERAAQKRAEEEERMKQQEKARTSAAANARRSGIPVPRPSIPARTSASAPPLPPSAPPLPPPNVLPLPPKAKRG